MEASKKPQLPTKHPTSRARLHLVATPEQRADGLARLELMVSTVFERLVATGNQASGPA